MSVEALLSVSRWDYYTIDSKTIKYLGTGLVSNGNSWIITHVKSLQRYEKFTAGQDVYA